MSERQVDGREGGIPSPSEHRLAARLGISAVGVFALALIVFARLNPGFDPGHDYVSQLGAVGQPHAPGWNLIGFVSVGALLAGFGVAYGRLLRDRLVGGLLALFGLGFGATGVPIDLGDATAPVSKAHVVAISVGTAAWLLALARMAHLTAPGRSVHRLANVAAALLVIAIAGQLARLWPMPVTHRLVFAVVFGWVGLTSTRLLRDSKRIPSVELRRRAAEGGAVRR